MLLSTVCLHLRLAAYWRVREAWGSRVASCIITSLPRLWLCCWADELPMGSTLAGCLEAGIDSAARHLRTPAFTHPMLLSTVCLHLRLAAE